MGVLIRVRCRVCGKMLDMEPLALRRAVWERWSNEARDSFVGLPRTDWAFEGCSQYEKRIGKLLPLAWETVPEARGIKDVEAVRRKKKKRILQRIRVRLSGTS